MAQRAPPDSDSGPMPSSFDDSEFANEKVLAKVFRKIKEEPLVPLGMGLTVFAFVNASRAVRAGDSLQANRMFRARVIAQGFTVLAMVAGGLYYNQDRQRSKELRKIQQETEAEEKRQKWIRELEARDEENKARRAMLLNQKTAMPAPSQQQEQKQQEQKQEQKQEQEQKQKQKQKLGDADANTDAATGQGEAKQTTTQKRPDSILSRVSPWGPAEKKAAEEQAKAAEEQAKAAEEQTKAAGTTPDIAVASPDTTTDNKTNRRENPKSTLAAQGELNDKKKEVDDSKK